MSEKHIPRLEHHESHEKAATHEHSERVEKHVAEQAERARQEKSTENVAKIQELAKAEAAETKKISADEQSNNEADSMVGMQSSLKSTAYQRVLDRTQQKLSKPARAFSKITHNAAVDKISAVSSQTVARPSGILGGSICAFLGSVIVVYYSRHYGFKYNYLLLFMLFIGGYAVGAFLELAVWVLYSRKQRY